MQHELREGPARAGASLRELVRFLPAVSAFLAVLLLTTAGVAVARRDLADNDRAIVRERLAQTRSLVTSIGLEVASTLDSAELVADASNGNPARFRGLMAERLQRNALRNLALIRLERGGAHAITTAGRRPTLLTRLLPRLASLRTQLAQDPRVRVLGRSADGSTIALVAPGSAVRPDLAVYGELDLTTALHRGASALGDLDVAVYLGDGEARSALFASTTSALPIRANRAEGGVRLFGVEARVVVGSRSPPSNAVSRALPWLALAYGIATALGFAALIELMRRRRDEALALVSRLTLKNRELDGLSSELASSERRYRELVERATDIVFVLDATGTIVSINQAAERSLERPREQLIGARLVDLVVPGAAEIVAEQIALALTADDDEPRFEAALRAADGRAVTLEFSTARVLEGDRVVGLQGVARDVTERRAFEHELARRSFHDSLTGLANRALLVERIDHALARPSTAERSALLVIDLDDFKTVNDSLGHVEGDEILTMLGRRIARAVEPVETIARLGGDEFAVLLEDADAAEAERVAGEILAMLDRPFSLKGREQQVCGSIGIALGRLGLGSSDLLRNAEIAMHRAKKRPDGEAFSLFSTEMFEAVRERMELKIELQHAIDSEAFTVHYQPIIDLASGRTIAFEALVRWPHDTRGLLGPGSFVPLAEETALISSIGAWVLREACRRMVAWRIRQPDLLVHVNVSGRQLADPAFPETVRAILSETRLPAAALVLEITETVLLQASSARVLDELKQLGLAIAVDDFGSGYSSLEYLRTFPVDMLKIAQGFVQKLRTVEDVRFFEAVIGIAHSLGIATVAEGVETMQQHDAVRRARCTQAQGFLFSRAIDGAGVLELLGAEHRRTA